MLSSKRAAKTKTVDDMKKEIYMEKPTSLAKNKEGKNVT